MFSFIAALPAITSNGIFAIVGVLIIEPRREKTGFLQTQISCAVTAQLISAFVFASWIVQSLYFLEPKSQASNHIQ